MRPICNQCARTTRPQDCEYSDIPGRTRTEKLEQDVARLEARLRELENPEDPLDADRVLLHDPNAQQVSISALSPHVLDSEVMPVVAPGGVGPNAQQAHALSVQPTPHTKLDTDNAS